MGSTIDAWIEYDQYGRGDGKEAFSEQPECLPLPEWSDMSHAKDYPVYGAIFGVRNSTGIEPLFVRRGIPENPSSEVEKGLDAGDDMASWLYPSEVIAALAHHSVTEEVISLEMRCVMRILEFMASELGDQRVRLVFRVE